MKDDGSRRMDKRVQIRDSMFLGGWQEGASRATCGILQSTKSPGLPGA